MVSVCSKPNMVPVRPKPVIISSTMSSASSSRAISAMAGSQSGGGTTFPAVPWIGSTRIAASEPTVAASICWRATSTQARPQPGCLSLKGQR